MFIQKYLFVWTLTLPFFSSELDRVSIALFQYCILPLSGVYCKMLKNVQSRETGNLEYTKHKTKTSN